MRRRVSQDSSTKWERGGKQGLCPVPDEPTPAGGGAVRRGSRVQKYGMTAWGDLFTARQKVALVWLLDAVHCKEVVETDTALACALNRVTMSDMPAHVGTQWPRRCSITFGRQALPIVWDFAEVAVFSGRARKLEERIRADAATLLKHRAPCTKHRLKPLTQRSTHFPTSQRRFGSRTRHTTTRSRTQICRIFSSCGSNGRYRSIRYCMILLIATIRSHLRSVRQCRTKQSAYNGRLKDRAWFEETMAMAFAEGRRVLTEDGIGCVVFAHKTTEGWEALLSGMIRGGWTITGSWPIATEMGSRLRARESAALATSVHLVCRPRPNDAPIGDWGEVHRELPRRVAEWMERLQSEHVRGADLVFACIGPALEIYSRYSKVVDAEDREIPLGGDPEATEPYKRGYLAYVWEAVGRAALEQVLGTAEATSTQRRGRCVGRGCTVDGAVFVDVAEYEWRSRQQATGNRQ